jgi:hypothetical protein
MHKNKNAHSFFRSKFYFHLLNNEYEKIRKLKKANMQKKRLTSLSYFLLCRIRKLLNFLRLRVFTPNAGFPQGLSGRERPIGARPSPPP